MQTTWQAYCDPVRTRLSFPAACAASPEGGGLCFAGVDQRGRGPAAEVRLGQPAAVCEVLTICTCRRSMQQSCLLCISTLLESGNRESPAHPPALAHRPTPPWLLRRLQQDVRPQGPNDGRADVRADRHHAGKIPRQRVERNRGAHPAACAAGVRQVSAHGPPRTVRHPAARVAPSHAPIRTTQPFPCLRRCTHKLAECAPALRVPLSPLFDRFWTDAVH